MTVMQWGNSEGIQGRCDAKCHNASEPQCDCMCGGRYHGRGLDGSLEKTIKDDGERIWEAAKKRAAADGYDIEKFDIQLRLI